MVKIKLERIEINFLFEFFVLFCVFVVAVLFSFF